MARTKRTGRIVRRTMRGFALTEAGLGLVVASMVAVASYVALFEQQGDNKAIAQGTAMLSLQGAAQQYLTTYYSQLVQPGGGTVAGVASPLNPTVAELYAVGALKGSWSGTAYNGGNYRIQIQQFPTGCVAPNCNLDGLIWIDRPIVDNGNRVDFPRLGLAVQTIKSDGAMSTVASPATLIGMGGKWNAANPVGGQPGILAVRFGYNSASFAQFYRRDGSLPMTADIAANGYNVNNAKAVNAQQVNLPAGNSLNIAGVQVYGDGTNAAIRAPGNLYLQGPNGNGAIGLVASNGNFSGNMAVSGTHTTYGNQYANGALVARSMVYLPALAWAGWGCGGNGITTDPNGQLLFCKAGVWTKSGGASNVVAVDSGDWQPAAIASCPGGYTLTGGSCDMYRGGDGREAGPRTCAPSGNGYYCNEGNGGFCIARAVCSS
ncbi:hypothetical protein [Ralstonia pseudosolanacearum]|uniref:hypothetical protein n=1 Tax=Ralstonia pseudosolanacearum TaxID=1310165 RepID=UPI001268DB7F|nr:hypothetical protein [Ralstonia pseudosolanacearum]